MGTRDDQVGSNVKHLREALGMSQAEVAEGMTKDGCAGFYPQTILKVEKGTRSLKFTEADSLARVLRVSMSTLLGSRDASEDVRRALANFTRAAAIAKTRAKEAELARETAARTQAEAEVRANIASALEAKYVAAVNAEGGTNGQH